jgi:hypothetical protein
MTRLAPQVTGLMRDDELDSLIRDHYRGEAQTLTTGAEENLLQLAHMLGQPTAPEAERWQAIVADYQRHKKMGGATEDPSIRVTNGLIDIARSVAELQPKVPLADTVQALGGELSSAFGQQLGKHMGQQLAQQLAAQITRLIEQQTQQLRPLQQSQHALTEQLATPLAAIAQLATQLENGQAQSQQQLRASLDATAHAVHTLEASTQALAANSQAAEGQRMIDALLSLSVTYRQLIMPLVGAVERLGVGSHLGQINHAEVERVQQQLNRLANGANGVGGAGGASGAGTGDVGGMSDASGAQRPG